eukprot:CAMPEP_0184500078 /NCGR_PEP_ID=MMETSP0113_2-20130426/43586_1 /TAXON_ID=91329 /ORGANISM="Norrisiella sphaerica, Strain BC52" /LENGTH=812 /DNA_ID=CAMNT_0026888291 /DNA_START=147 /DNA_END=2585 /DNA_ORIENTATION=+
MSLTEAAQEHVPCIEAADKAIQSALNGEGGWSKAYVKEGVEVHFNMVDDGTKVLKYTKGVAELPISPAVAAELVTGFEYMNLWDKQFDRGRILQMFPDVEQERKIVYMRYKAPWPVSQRDFVNISEIRVRADGSRRVIATEYKHKDGPEESRIVRAKLMYGGWEFQAKGDGNECTATYITAMDPRGTLPTWLVNQVANDTPMCLAAIRDFIDRNPDKVEKLRGDAMKKDQERCQRGEAPALSAPANEEESSIEKKRAATIATSDVAPKPVPSTLTRPTARKIEGRGIAAMGSNIMLTWQGAVIFLLLGGSLLLLCALKISGAVTMADKSSKEQLLPLFESMMWEKIIFSLSLLTVSLLILVERRLRSLPKWALPLVGVPPLLSLATLALLPATNRKHLAYYLVRLMCNVPSSNTMDMRCLNSCPSSIVGLSQLLNKVFLALAGGNAKISGLMGQSLGGLAFGTSVVIERGAVPVIVNVMMLLVSMYIVALYFVAIVLFLRKKLSGTHIANKTKKAVTSASAHSTANASKNLRSTARATEGKLRVEEGASASSAPGSENEDTFHTPSSLSEESNGSQAGQRDSLRGRAQSSSSTGPRVRARSQPPGIRDFAKTDEKNRSESLTLGRKDHKFSSNYRTIQPHRRSNRDEDTTNFRVFDAKSPGHETPFRQVRRRKFHSFTKQSRRLVVKVVGSKIRSTFWGNHVRYVCEVKRGMHTFRVQRRYSEFADQLHATLCERFGVEKMSKFDFPPKTGIIRNTTASFQELRRNALNTYLQKCLADPEICGSKEGTSILIRFFLPTQRAASSANLKGSIP